MRDFFFPSSFLSAFLLASAMKVIYNCANLCPIQNVVQISTLKLQHSKQILQVKFELIFFIALINFQSFKLYSIFCVFIFSSDRNSFI